MTKYRKINNGYWDFLQYEKEYTFLFFFKKKKWEYVWKPYYDQNWGRYLDLVGDKCIVNSLDDNLEFFVKKWLDVEDYFKWAMIEQERLERIAFEKNKEIKDNKGKITNIN